MKICDFDFDLPQGKMVELLPFKEYKNDGRMNLAIIPKDENLDQVQNACLQPEDCLALGSYLLAWAHKHGLSPFPGKSQVSSEETKWQEKYQDLVQQLKSLSRKPSLEFNEELMKLINSLEKLHGPNF